MKKTFITVVLIALLLSGCIRGNATDPQLIVTWRSVSSSEVALLSAEEGLRLADKQYAKTNTEYDMSHVEIEAKLGQKTATTDFEFEVVSVNPNEKIRNNAILIDPVQAEKGSVVVRAEGQEVILPYEIFASGHMESWGNPRGKSAFSFQAGELVMFDEGDLKPATEADQLPFRASVCELPSNRSDFWNEFVGLNNLQDYEYEYKEFRPDYDHFYLIKTHDGGYAVVSFMSQTGSHYSFMYKYSETGIFD